MTQLFIFIFGLALSTWVAKYLYVLYYYKKQKTSINKSEAKIAVLRMLLKAKLRRKGSHLQEQYREDKVFLGEINNKLDMLTTFSFNRTSDYEEVISILYSLSESIDLQTVRKTPGLFLANQQQMVEKKNSILKHAGLPTESSSNSAAQPISDNETNMPVKAESAPSPQQMPEMNRWIQLLKYDKGNIYIIKEIVETTEELKKKIDLYNSEQKSKELHLRAPDLITISGFEGLRSIVNHDTEISRKKKIDRKNQRLAEPNLSAVDYLDGDNSSAA